MLISLLVMGTLVLSAPPCLAQVKLQAQLIFPLQQKHVHSSSIVACSNGDLLVCWYEGSGERRANDVRIRGARLQKRATTWSEVFEMADTPGQPDCNPVLFIDSARRLHLFWVAVVANRWEFSLLRHRISTNYEHAGPPEWDWQEVILLKPGEEFAKATKEGFAQLDGPELAWAEYAPRYEHMLSEAAKDPRKREIGWMPRTHPLELPGGRVLLPLYSDGFNFSIVAISNDGGMSWRPQPGLPIIGRGNVQPSLVRKKDGTLLAYMRDNGDAPGRVMLSRSTDGGETWTVARDTKIPNPGSSLEVIVLKDGRWLMAFNDTEKGRHQLALALSADEGKTWPYKRYLEKKMPGPGQFAYPSLIQTEDGRLHVTYSYHVKGGKSIKHVSLTAGWLQEAE